MSIVVKIKCDAGEYAQELAKAIALGREAAAQLEKLAIGGIKDGGITLRTDIGQGGSENRKQEAVRALPRKDRLLQVGTVQEKTSGGEE